MRMNLETKNDMFPLAIIGFLFLTAIFTLGYFAGYRDCPEQKVVIVHDTIPKYIIPCKLTIYTPSHFQSTLKWEK